MAEHESDHPHTAGFDALELPYGTQGVSLEHFRSMVQSHDLTYAWSDDARVRQRGADQLSAIVDMRHTLARLMGPSVDALTRDIWNTNIEQKLLPDDWQAWKWREPSPAHPARPGVSEPSQVPQSILPERRSLMAEPQSDNPYVDPGFSHEDAQRPLDDPQRFDDFGVRSAEEAQFDSTPLSVVQRIQALWNQAFQQRDQGMEQ
jgi:hypothetical protein